MDRVFSVVTVAVIFSVVAGVVITTWTVQPLADSDRDGLSNYEEILRGTDPHDPDTDGDNLPDGVEVKADDALPGADPLRKDVYVEFDHADGCGLNETDVRRLKQTFAEAPVDNPDGSTGVTLHIKQDENLGDTFFGPNEAVRAVQRHYDRNLQGYHYIVGGVSGERAVNWQSASYIRCDDPTTFLHELGHSLGLNAVLSKGIDGRVQPDQYPSTMNYYSDVLDYSNGTNGPDDFDEWGYIERNMSTAPVTELCERVGASSSDCERDY